MNKSLIASIVAVSFGLIASPAPAQEPLKIGFIAALSGAAGALGQDQYDAFMLVVERNGGELGGVPVEIIKEDTQRTPVVATQVVQKLIEKEQVPIITGVTYSNVLNAIYRPIEENEVFLILSNAATSPFAGADCSPFRYVVSWQNDQQAEVVGEYAQNQGYERMVLMAPNYQGGRDYVSGFKRHYDGEVVAEMFTPLNQLDFSAELAQVTAMQPDAVFVFYPGELGINFVRQYRQAGLLGQIPLLSASTTDGITLRALKDTALGVISGSFWGPDFANPSSRQFVEEFKEEYGRIPSQYAAQGYDAALLLDSAIAKVDGNVEDKEAFKAALKEADFESVRGDFEFNNNNFPIHDMHIFEVAKDEEGGVSLKTIATPLEDHQDAYHDECPME